MQVLHLVHGLALGGLENLVADLCARGRERGVDAAVVSFGPDGPLREVLRDRGVPLRWLGDVAGMRPATLAAIAGEVRARGANVLHAHDLGPFLNAAGARLLAPGAALVCTFHEVRAPAGAQRLAARGAARLSRALVACGEEVRRTVASWAPPRARLDTIANGVAPGRAPGAEERRAARTRLELPPEAFTVGYVGRLEEEKGPDLLLEAFLAALGGRAGAHLVVAGDGSLREALRRRAAAHPRIRLLGPIPGARALLPALDVYAQPSRREGRSVSMLEAMAAALPTVGTDIPAVRELHRDGETALLAPPGDVAALGRHLAALADDALLRARLGAAARRRAEQEGDGGMVERYAALYREIAARA